MAHILIKSEKILGVSVFVEAQTCFPLKDTVQLSEMYKMFFVFLFSEKQVHGNIYRTAVTLIQFFANYLFSRLYIYNKIDLNCYSLQVFQV